VDETWQEFRVALVHAQSQWNVGDAQPFQALWSKGDDVSLFGGQGGLQIGWAAVGSRLERAAQQALATRGSGLYSCETLVEQVTLDLAYTVAIERVQQGDQVVATVRVTQIYRCESGRWRILHRHTDYA